MLNVLTLIIKKCQQIFFAYLLEEKLVTANNNRRGKCNVNKVKEICFLYSLIFFHHIFFEIIILETKKICLSVCLSVCLFVCLLVVSAVVIELKFTGLFILKMCKTEDKFIKF